ncbi:MAG TPA: SDR family NAD(P)-dependent oxidoreductase [Dysgonomonas sp.]|uniref:SDR family NAD(P)-dependent oxidoreductase n=3 Tax=unclassified Dysgonomonas TaxID=2630389 RepID=UPI002C3768DA|nr:SDR family NAD(P)-dependent oxidoreductase [Dysgonomonas sp.]HML65384.1 SDR family NAD(P)-dependent oxidoreductase [Dysgonomonas sp.]
MQHYKELLIVSPFEIPNTTLALETIKTGAYPVLHLGRNLQKAQESLDIMSESTTESFGVCFVDNTTLKLDLPPNVSRVIFPAGMDISVSENIEKLCQVHSLDEAARVIDSGISNIIVKGNEGAGKVSAQSSFILFQSIANKYLKKGINIYIQGGVGIHTTAACLALGAKGVILDSQISLFPECGLTKDQKNIFSKLSGSETTVIDNFRILLRKNSPKLPVNTKYSDIIPLLGGLDVNKNILPMGQDVSLSIDFVQKYKNLNTFVSSFYEAIYGHIQQAKRLQTIKSDSKLAKSLDIKYPIAQGPMARVSDVPEFACSVADAGALPFIAMGMTTGDAARNLIAESSRLLNDKVWGVGLLGFIPTKQREEQTKYILEYRPPVVLIAGGSPALAKPFEKEGIKAFIHVPSQTLLDIFLKEGAKNFVFEGRESGGHIGPLSSFILWERQIYRLLKEDNLSVFSVFFAGGIHDAFSSAFVSIMSATLNAKGAKIGVLMGSSYLYTKEAVETKAILPEFQKLAIEENDTVILQAAPGQETQSLKSPFTEYFGKEKEKLQRQNLDSKEIWIRLEELNLGRSRIATKGIERIGTDLVKLNEEEQKEKGLYMIGQIAALNQKEMTLDELHKHVAVDNNELLSQLPDIALPTSNTKPLDVAIVGISGIFPDAHNIEEYWRNIVLGKNCITEVPDSRWNKDLYYDSNSTDTDKVVSKWGGFIPSIDFDPLEFGMTPQSLASIEPTQLLSLLVAKQALTDAGYENLSEIDLENTSVIFGAEGATELAASYGFRGYAKQVFGELPDVLKNSLPRLNEDSFAGVLSNVISGRIANRLNLGGRNYTVDAACASSLAALDLGCQELFSNRSDMVLLGGADLHNGINDFLMFSCTHALSRKGYSASFDADSDGIALGEGIGVLVLKRLADAECDGNKIYAVIKGMGGSSDGKSLGMTAPNRKGQIKALQRAYQNAGILPSQVEMIEAHGTGTVVGDRTELRALTDMFLESGAIKGQTLLGSVKTQIGHAKCAAGIAGVIKAALSIYYKVQPPTLHLNKPNPYYDKDSSPFVFNSHSGYWDSEKRIAGVSAFGFGGTNFHVVMENHKGAKEHNSSLPLWPSELFVFRGDSLIEAKQQLQKIKELLSYNDTINIKNIAYSLAVNSKKEVQVSIIASDCKELHNRINAALAGKEEYGIYLKNAKEGKVAFMFSGQGSQRVNMARDMFVVFPAMRRLLTKHKEYEKILFPYSVFDEETRKEQEEVITDTRNAQPLLGIVDFAFAEFLKSLGIIPDMVAGHSYGELAALCFAGAFDAEVLVPLSHKRALSILDAIEEDKGKMIAVSLPETEIITLLDGEKDVWAVNFNSPKQIVLAGSTEGINSFMRKLSNKNIAYKELNVACAFHSPLLHKSRELYADVLQKVDFKTLNIPVWSNTTAEYYPQKTQEIKNRLAEHLIKPVLFTRQVENMYNEGARIFIEVGPGRVLTGLVQSILGDKVSAFETENKSFNGVTFILHTLAKYLSTGKSVDVEKLFENRNTSIVNIDKPEQYKKSPIVWHINGHNAIPTDGRMPSTGAYPIIQPIMNLKNMTNNLNNNSTSGLSSSDQVILEYLNSMRMMLQSQRDVMLGYLGHIPNNISTPIQTNSVQQVQVLPMDTSSQQVEQRQEFVDINTSSSKSAEISTQALSIDDIKGLLLETVSEKTGYPIEMLGLDLDLEADLSIDSIKRMEIIGSLREKLNISGSMEDAEDTVEKLASVKTLNGLIDWIKELANSSINQTQGAIMPDVVDSVVPIQTQAVTIDDIKTLLLETVSEKTGYPADMLGLDLDLEADLSIDSIKRMEIIGSLREKLNISGSIEDADDTIEKLASVKTLNGLIDWIKGLANGVENKDSISQSQIEQIAVKESDTIEGELIRMSFELEETTLNSENNKIQGKRFALTDDNGVYAQKVKNAMEANGAIVDLIQGDENLTQYDGLVILNSSASPRKYSIKEVFSMIKNVDLARIKWVYTFSDVLGNIKMTEGVSKLKEIQGFPGLIKSLAHEFPTINFRAIVSHSIFDPNLLSQITVDELLTEDDTYTEIIYKDNKRYFAKPKPVTLVKNGSSHFSLDKDAVVVVFGGAQGITPELISELSKEYPCNYILVGRSDAPTEEFDKYKSLDSKDKIRRYLITEENMKSPGEIEKKVQKIFKTNQINENVAKIEQNGAKVTYISLDIKNEEALRDFIKKTYDTYNRIDGIFHAAGLLDDKLFIHKTFESFYKVYSTKVTPLHVLLDELRSELKLFVMFSSVASAYGNKGQSDYASANSVFDHIASILNDKVEARILTINWGPWKGTGMVNETLEAEFKKRGVSLIPLKKGAEYFVNELKYGKESHILVMGGADDVKSFLNN